jgi:hypothetical protein
MRVADRCERVDCPNKKTDGRGRLQGGGVAPLCAQLPRPPAWKTVGYTTNQPRESKHVTADAYTKDGKSMRVSHTRRLGRNRS